MGKTTVTQDKNSYENLFLRARVKYFVWICINSVVTLIAKGVVVKYTMFLFQRWIDLASLNIYRILRPWNFFCWKIRTNGYGFINIWHQEVKMGNLRGHMKCLEKMIKISFNIHLWHHLRLIIFWNVLRWNPLIPEWFFFLHQRN